MKLPPIAIYATRGISLRIQEITPPGLNLEEPGQDCRLCQMKLPEGVEIGVSPRWCSAMPAETTRGL